MNLLYVCDTYCFVALSFRETESKNKRLVMWPAYHMHMCISTKVHKLKEFQVKTLTKNFNRGDTEYHGGHSIKGVMPSPY